MRQSLADLKASLHAFRLAQAEKDQKGKGTGVTYDRHVRHYTEFWEAYQSKLCLADPLRASLPSFPITAAKVAMFLQHETTREKVGFVVKPILVTSLMCNLSP
jgi:stalled ribosome alternative rescue factor ArfA